MIGFQHQDVGRANPFHDQSRCMAQIGQKTDVSAWRSQQKTNRVLGIMRDHESFHPDIAHLEASTGAEQPALQSGLKLKFEGFLRRAIAIDRDAQLFA